MWCHLLLAMPALGLILFAFLPLPYAVPAYALLNLPALGLYYLVYRAQQQQAQVGLEAMVGQVGRVVALHPEGGLVNCLVRSQGETWSAFATEPVAVGTEVEVVAFAGARALVRPRPEPTAAENLERILNSGLRET